MKMKCRFLLLVGLWPLLVGFASARVEPTPTDQPEESPPAAEQHEATLRRLDEPAAKSYADDRLAPASSDDGAVEKSDAPEENEDAVLSAGEKARRSRQHGMSKKGGDDDQVSVFSDLTVLTGQKVHGAAVAVMGNLKIDGEVTNDAVAVMGDSTINGVVHGQAVTIMGDLTLGPKAHVMGDVVTVGGHLVRDPEAIVDGKVVQQAIGKRLHVPVPVIAWWSHGLSQGRPLAFGAHLAWVWTVAVISVLFYVLIAAVFPRAVRRCGDMLVNRPGLTILTAFLSVLALPILFVLLLVTIVGIPVALLALPIGVVLALLFGKAGIYALVGRKLTGERWALPLAVILGALIFITLYLVPVLGLALSFLVSFLGFGCVVLAIFTGGKKSAPVSAVAGPSTAMPGVAPRPETASAPPTPGTSSPSAAPVAATSVTGIGTPPVAEDIATPPLVSAPVAEGVPPLSDIPPPLMVALPRVGFWLRTAAMLIDLILVGVITAILHMQGPTVILLLAIYGAVMWKLKATTVGGIVCGIKVVRLDGRAIDWPTAVVRALGCFLSLAVACLGFVWVAFDEEKQSWHDKIAGTTVVKVPKGTSLV